MSQLQLVHAWIKKCESKHVNSACESRLSNFLEEFVPCVQNISKPITTLRWEKFQFWIAPNLKKLETGTVTFVWPFGEMPKGGVKTRLTNNIHLASSSLVASTSFAAKTEKVKSEDYSTAAVDFFLVRWDTVSSLLEKTSNVLSGESINFIIQSAILNFAKPFVMLNFALCFS